MTKVFDATKFRKSITKSIQGLGIDFVILFLNFVASNTFVIILSFVSSIVAYLGPNVKIRALVKCQIILLVLI